MKIVLSILLVIIISPIAHNQIINGKINIKRLEKDFSKVQGLCSYTEINNKQVETIRTYMYKYEVSNLFYKLFLNDLKLKGEKKKLELAMVDSSGWEKIQGFFLPYKDYYFSHPSFDTYPVVNVSKSGALLFCEWLTDWYNSQPNRTYKNQKVKFTLPTKDAWEVSARGGIKKITYPWGTNYLRDIKTLKYLCNFNPIGEENLLDQNENCIHVVKNTKKITQTNTADYPGSDQYMITAPVKSFTANSIGIYNLSGNVAEMVLEGGATKGGSWNSSGYEVRIDAPDPYAGINTPSPYIGFRILMIVEEK